MLSLTLPWIWRHPLARRQRALAFGRYFWWQARCRLAAGSHRIPWVNNSSLLLSRSMTGATGNLYVGLHEWPDMAFVLHLLRPGDLFLDVGSNVGSYTVLASAVVGAKTIAAEPSPQALSSLHENIRENRIESLVTVLPNCIGAESGVVRFTTDGGPMNRVVSSDYDGSVAEVDVLRLDDLDDAGQSCCWKLDVEGFELDVLNGATEALSHSEVRVILLEDRSTPVVERMRSLGFISCGYDPWSRELTPNCSSDSANQIWIRDLNWASRRLSEAPKFSVVGFQI